MPSKGYYPSRYKPSRYKSDHRERTKAKLAGRSLYEAALEDAAFVERFGKLIAKAQRAENGCLILTGVAEKNEYPLIDFGGFMLRVHRLVAIRAGSAAPADPAVMHACDTPACIEPKCLTGGTNAENVADMVAKGRLRRNNTSGVTGVCQSAGKWVAKLGRRHLGTFDTREQAAHFREGVLKHGGWRA